MYLKFFLCCVFCFGFSSGARILGIMPTPSYSHQIVFHPLWKELSLRGHQVTVITTDPLNDPKLTNLTEIDIHFAYSVWSKFTTAMTKLNKNVLQLAPFAINSTANMTRTILLHDEVQKLLKEDAEPYDLVMAELLQPVLFAFARKFKCPLIGLATRDVFQSNYHSMGNPSHPILNPDLYFHVKETLSFLDRLKVIGGFLYGIWISRMVYPISKNLMDEFFGEDYPSVRELEQSMDMMFVYAEPILHRVRPLLPTIIHIGGDGMHIKPPKPLPKDLQKTLDDAKNGFIYFSLGTNAKSKDLPVETRNMLLEVFSELPYTVLWKYEIEMEQIPKGNYDNVKISKWYPQQDIFNHSNIKLFITQGGLQSIEEAIHHHIPIVGLPVFGTQHSTVERVVSKGIGVMLDIRNLNREEFLSAITEVINNPKYRESVKKVAKQIRDQPMTGLDKAVWWTEYILRHNGAKHLESPMRHLPTYQYFLIDVIGFILLIIVLIIYLFVKILKLSIRLVKKLFKTKSKSKKE